MSRAPTRERMTRHLPRWNSCLTLRLHRGRRAHPGIIHIWLFSRLTLLCRGRAEFLSVKKLNRISEWLTRWQQPTIITLMLLQPTLATTRVIWTGRVPRLTATLVFRGYNF